MGKAKKSRIASAMQENVLPVVATAAIVAATPSEVISTVASEVVPTVETPSIVAPVATYKNKLEKYMAIAKQFPQPFVRNGIECPVTSKQSFTIAVYLLVCSKLGISYTRNEPSAIAFCAHLLACTSHISYCKLHSNPDANEHNALKNEEITAQGVSGYAKLVTQAKAKSGLPGGELSSRTQAHEGAALALFEQHSEECGFSAVLAGYKARQSSTNS